MATIRSVPLRIGEKYYDLQFGQPDVIAFEEDMNVGYIFPFRTVEVDGNNIPAMMSFKLSRVILHRGLKTRNKKGELLYALPQTPAGAEQAGDLYQEYINGGGTMIDLWLAGREAFSGWFGKKKDGEPEPAQGTTSKNSHGTG